MLENVSLCNVFLGQGASGFVIIPGNKKTLPYMVGDKTIQLPIVLKMENVPQNNIGHYFGLDILNDRLYISGEGGITTEALILMLIEKLRTKTVHLPLLLGYATCITNSMVSSISTLKYGLDELIKIDLSDKISDEKDLWFRNVKINKTFTSRIATLTDLFDYIYFSKNKDDTVILPNDIKCNISELYDYICISYLATYKLLTENNIFPRDMHGNNIFIQWLDDTSYYNDTNIKNLKHIIYKVGNKFFKIKTFGFIIIFGDTGRFIIKVRDDITLIGEAIDIKSNYSRYDKLMKETPNNMDFIYYNINSLSQKQFRKTVAYKIMNTEPYCDLPRETSNFFGKNLSYLDNMLSTTELLDFYYEKYGINKYEKKNNSILLTIE